MKQRIFFAWSIFAVFLLLGFQWFWFASFKQQVGRDAKLSQYLMQQYDQISGRNDETQKDALFKRLARLQTDQGEMLQDAYEKIFLVSKVYGLVVVLLGFYFWQASVRQQKKSCVGNPAEPPKQ